MLFLDFFAQNANILVQPVQPAKELVRISVLEVTKDLPYKTLKNKVSMFSLIFTFSRFLAQNRNILDQPVRSEFAKELVRITVLGENLDLF